MKKTGFTLIEVLVVIAIMGIFFVVGSVNFNDFQKRKVVSGVADQIRGDLRLAQSDAITGQKPNDPQCNTPKILDSYSFEIVSNTEYNVGANCVVGASTHKVIRDVKLPSGIHISTPAPLIFKILGQGTNLGINSTWTLTVSQTGTTNTAVVTVTSGGQIQ